MQGGQPANREAFRYGGAYAWKKIARERFERKRRDAPLIRPAYGGSVPTTEDLP